MRRKSVNVILAACAVAVSLFGVAACAGGRPQEQGKEGASQQQPAPAKISADELKKLRWIEGSWRGTGDVETPFYERYYFEGDSTLVVEGFPDETLGKANDVTRFELKEGQFGNGGEGSRWAASELTDDHITFVPVRGARNTFIWQKGSDGSWTAVLEWPAADGKPARKRVYKMERWPKK